MECMQNIAPAPREYSMEVVDAEHRNGYEVRKIRFNVSEWCRIPAYLLVPDGKGPFPAIVMLHDHGAHFSIGKEKMIRPFHVKAEVLADADDWAARCYDSNIRAITSQPTAMSYCPSMHCSGENEDARKA